MSETNLSAKKIDAAAAEREVLMGEYLAAFQKANPGKKKPGIRYEQGWFLVSAGLFDNRHRKAELVRMRDRLLARAAENTPLATSA